MNTQTHCFNLANTTRHARVKCSDLISIELPENATSGYRWQLAPNISLPGLKLIAQQFKNHYANQAVGIRSFVFEATGEYPQASLHFRLKPLSDSRRSVLQKFDLNVDIQLPVGGK